MGNTIGSVVGGSPLRSEIGRWRKGQREIGTVDWGLTIADWRLTKKRTRGARRRGISAGKNGFFVSRNGFSVPNGCSVFWARIAVFWPVSREIHGSVRQEWVRLEVSHIAISSQRSARAEAVCAHNGRGPRWARTVIELRGWSLRRVEKSERVVWAALKRRNVKMSKRRDGISASLRDWGIGYSRHKLRRSGGLRARVPDETNRPARPWCQPVDTSPFVRDSHRPRSSRR